MGEANVADLVLKRIWQGSVEALLDPDLMRQVDAVISIVKPKHLASFHLSIHHLVIPVRDGDDTIFEWFDIAFDFMERALKEGKTLLIHCMAGRSRSSTILIGYMLTKLEFVSYDQALAALHAVRPSIALMPSYEKRLRELADSASINTANLNSCVSEHIKC